MSCCTCTVTLASARTTAARRDAIRRAAAALFAIADAADRSTRRKNKKQIVAVKH
jgi:hypothetical protein